MYNFVEHPSESSIKTWGDLAYLADADRRCVLNAPFGKYKEMRKQACDAVEKFRIERACMEHKSSIREAARSLNLTIKEFERRAGKHGITLAWG